MHVYTQNGEEDTVLRDDLKRVKQKLSLTFAIAIIGTCIVFGLLYYLGIDLLSYYIEAGSFMIYYNEKPYIDEFQQYVSDNDISTTDVGRILRTFKIKKNVEVTDNGKIII